MGQESFRSRETDHLGLALGGRPAAAFANRLMMPVSNDTLLRVVRRRIVEQNDELSVIGIDDFAFRRGQTYGTFVCDLERRRPVTCCRTELWIPLEPGSLPTLRYRRSPAIVVAASHPASAKVRQSHFTAEIPGQFLVEINSGHTWRSPCHRSRESGADIW